MDIFNGWGYYNRGKPFAIGFLGDDPGGEWTWIGLINAAYVFPLQARFENSLKGHVINAFKLAFVAPGKTIFMWILWLIIPATAVLLPRDVVLTFGWFYLLFAVSLPMYINSRILRNLFDKLMGEKTNDES